MNKQQIDQYLERIGFSGPINHDGETLDRLIWAHISTVPFESLDLHEYGIVPSLNVDDLFEKFVVKRRGGYCFELNSLFCSLLRALGFDARPLLCRILGPGREHPLPLHRATAVYFGDARYFADVGFGGQMPEGAVPFDGTPVSAFGSTFRIVPAGGRMLDLQRLDGESWTPSIRFSADPVDEVDFVPASFFCSTAPDSGFVVHRMANICRPDGFARIADSEFTLRTAARDETRTIGSPDEERALLLEYFGIRL